MRTSSSPVVTLPTELSVLTHGDRKPTAVSSGNRVLDALPAADFAQIEGDLEIVTLSAHQFTQSIGGTVRHVDFPIDAVLSVVARLANGVSVEVGTVGRESFVEADAALDSSTSSRTSFCQVKGRVGRMTVERFEERMTASPGFARLIRRNVRATLFSAQQFVACNAKHSVLRRCARWLSMTADRVGSAEFTLTHDFLSIMLGVRRAGVSEAADALSHLGAIEYRRGVVTVLDKAILEGAACECYQACRQAFVTSLAT